MRLGRGRLPGACGLRLPGACSLRLPGYPAQLDCLCGGRCLGRSRQGLCLAGLLLLCVSDRCRGSCRGLAKRLHRGFCGLLRGWFRLGHNLPPGRCFCQHLQRLLSGLRFHVCLGLLRRGCRRLSYRLPVQCASNGLPASGEEPARERPGRRVFQQLLCVPFCVGVLGNLVCQVVCGVGRALLRCLNAHLLQQVLHEGRAGCPFDDLGQALQGDLLRQGLNAAGYQAPAQGLRRTHSLLGQFIGAGAGRLCAHQPQANGRAYNGDKVGGDPRQILSHGNGGLGEESVQPAGSFQGCCRVLLAFGHQLASQAVPVHLAVGVQHVLHVLGDCDLLLKLLLRSPALASFPSLNQGKPRLERGQLRRLAPDVVVVFLHHPVVDGLSLGFRQERQGAGHAIAHGFQRLRRLVHPVVAGVRHRCVMPGYVLGSGLCAAAVVGVRQDLAQLFLCRANPVLVPLLHRLFQFQLRHPVLSLPLGVHGVQRGSVLPGDVRCDLLVACRTAGVSVPCPDGFRHLVGGFPCFKVPHGVGHVPPHLFLLDALPVRAGQLLVVLGQLVFRCLGRLVRPVVLVLLLPLGKLLWRQLASEVLCVKLRQVHARAALQVCVGLGPV